MTNAQYYEMLAKHYASLAQQEKQKEEVEEQLDEALQRGIAAYELDREVKQLFDDKSARL